MSAAHAADLHPVLKAPAAVEQRVTGYEISGGGGHFSGRPLELEPAANLFGLFAAAHDASSIVAS